jgi:hypothetical protein
MRFASPNVGYGAVIALAKQHHVTLLAAALNV